MVVPRSPQLISSQNCPAFGAGSVKKRGVFGLPWLKLNFDNRYAEVRDEDHRSGRTHHRLGDISTIEVGQIERPSRELEPETVGMSLEDGKLLLHRLQ